MQAGLWQHRDVKDRVFSFWDLVDAHELLDHRDELERARSEWLKANQEPR